MAEPTYTVFIKVPMPRGDFVDPPPVNWDSRMDEALWKILSGAAKTEVDWNEVADRFEVPVDFLFQQVAYLTERHASQVRAQVRKATAAAKGSAAPSPIQCSDSAGLGHQRTPSALSLRRDSPLPRNDMSSRAGTPLNLPSRPVISRNTSAGTMILRDPMSPRPGVGVAGLGRTGIDPRKRFSSLPITTTTARSPERRPEPQLEPERERSPSPGPAESSSTTSSEDESAPAQSRIIRRPPRYQPKEAASTYDVEEEDESEPAFQPYETTSDRASAQDLGSTLRGDGRGLPKRFSRNLGKDSVNHSQTSDSSSGSAAPIKRPGTIRDQRTPGPLSPRRTTELVGQSPGSKNRSYPHEESEGTPSMSSSFSDLDDASVTQSAMEEHVASQLNRGSASRLSLIFRNR